MKIEQFNEQLCDLIRAAAAARLQPHEVLGSLELAKLTYVMPTYLRMEAETTKTKQK